MSNYETSIKNIIDGILDIGGGQILDKRYVSLSGLLDAQWDILYTLHSINFGFTSYSWFVTLLLPVNNS